MQQLRPCSLHASSTRVPACALPTPSHVSLHKYVPSIQCLTQARSSTTRTAQRPAPAPPPRSAAAAAVGAPARASAGGCRWRSRCCSAATCSLYSCRLSSAAGSSALAAAEGAFQLRRALGRLHSARRLGALLSWRVASRICSSSAACSEMREGSVLPCLAGRLHASAGDGLLAAAHQHSAPEQGRSCRLGPQTPPAALPGRQGRGMPPGPAAAAGPWPESR